MLKKDLNSIQVQLISHGAIIGSAYFLGAGALLSDNGPSAVIAFLVGGVIVWLLSMSIGELSIGMPREGSFVSQSRELMGRHWAAGIGWSYWFNWCAYIPSEMVAGGLLIHGFFPQISVMVWAILFGALITLMNLVNVKSFGKVESALALLKIGAIGLFMVMAVGILTGLIGNHSTVTGTSLHDLSQSLPGGPFAFMVTMVLVLVNYQGAELVALSVAETEDVAHSIPRAARNVALRSIALYVIPLILLLFVFPWKDAKVEQSVFAEVLTRNGFNKLAMIFELVIISAALSCANSGLYGAVRSMYGLSKEGLAPKWLGRTNKHSVPHLATWFTIAICWSFLPLYVFFQSSNFYTWLLSVSGFTGAICWISITYCQIRMRRKFTASGEVTQLSYKMPWFPYLSWFSFWLQLGSILLLAAHPTLRSALYLGVPAFVVPALICWVKDRATGVSEAMESV